VLSNVRGTVQADILKEDQGQNTCIFSTEFALRCMADIQSWFIDHEVRNFYSVSISGYHMAEAGANPISQLAFTLANGFTYVEAYLARGMAVDDFAPNLSFFFSNGMDAEYTVLGRVARRIWAVAMRDRYGAGERSQKLKYHVQTSGRSLHAQEMDFNDIRTTLQALCAIYDNANSLHTNAYDEAVTTPSAESVRPGARHPDDHRSGVGARGQREPAAGLVRRRRAHRPRRGGGARRVRPDQRPRRGARRDGDRLPARPHPGRVDAVRAQEARRQPADRRREHLPGPDADGGTPKSPELARATDAEKQSQLDRLADFHSRHREQAPAALARLQQTATSGGNVFDALMDAVRVCSLGQISDAFFEVGGPVPPQRLSGGYGCSAAGVTSPRS
jgi:methylmalonyl-CoA mutase